ncbi:ABC transporter permease [Olsenella uli]|uniref:ABC transporter permease n=1 Tax=Olsenella uli TaxID=133926 RepID=UPI001957DB3A|nr:ABC transporter permease [Olsenella uli]MBM6815934.1 ABC transporter permease [Olsenella uli]
MSDSKNGMPAEKNDQAKDDAQEYSLNDDRRVKVLSPGALIAKRFFRNRLAVVGLVILVVMFVFSFIGGLVSPYGQDQTFSTMTKLNTQYAGITETTSLRYTAAPDADFGALVQSSANSAINSGATSFERSGVTYTIEQPASDLYVFKQGGEVVAYASTEVVSVPSGASTPSFDFQIAAITAVSNANAAGSAAPAPEVGEEGVVVVESGEENAAEDAAEAQAAGNTFEADGQTYSFDESGNVMDASGATVAMVSPFVMSASDGNTVIPDDLREALLTAVSADVSDVTYTDADGAEHTYTISYDAYSKVYNVTETTENLVYDRYASPSAEHWLGTDGNGMDMLTRLMYGGRVSLIIGFIVVFIAAGLGVIMGGISGYFGGWVDNLIMRIVDVFYCLPSMPIIIILGSAMDAMRLDPWIRMIYLMLILGFLSWPSIARLVRGQILSLREQEFMLATEATGISIPHRIIRHLIPNVMPQLIVSCTMSLGSTIITEATLSFLGLGVKFPFASWGNIISDVNNAFVMTNYWFIWIPAGICLLLAVLGFNFVGDGLRDAFDPKMNR